MDLLKNENNEKRCPLCGSDNRCGYAEGERECWCFSTPVPQALRDRVPPDKRNKACICRKCVEAYYQQHAPGK